jgi:hypothetical protein
MSVAEFPSAWSIGTTRQDLLVARLACKQLDKRVDAIAPARYSCAVDVASAFLAAAKQVNAY